MSELKFSVLVCTYNPNEYFEDMIASILSQSLRVNRIVISDDSNDSYYVDYIKNIIKKYSQFDIEYRVGPKRGVVENFLNSISCMSLHDVDWLFLADQDDVWETDKVKEYYRIIKGIKKNSGPCLVFSDSLLVDHNNLSKEVTLFEYQGLNKNLLKDESIFYSNCVQGATICMNTSLIEIVEESYEQNDAEKILMHDWWIALIARYFGCCYFINKPLIRYRQHEENIIGAVSKKNKIINIMFNFKEYYRAYKKVIIQRDFFIQKFKITNEKENIKELSVLKKISLRIFKLLTY